MRPRGAIRGAIKGVLIALTLATVDMAGRPSVAAETLPPPAATPILVVDGHIATGNGAGIAAFDLALLKSLPVITFKTTTPWSEGENEFKGVRIRDLLDRLGAQGTSVIATAVDDYQIAIPMDDLRANDVIVAYAMNGQPLPADNKGPLWIVYPFSDQPALQNDLYYARCVWQLNRLTVQ